MLKAQALFSSCDPVADSLVGLTRLCSPEQRGGTPGPDQRVIVRSFSTPARSLGSASGPQGSSGCIPAGAPTGAGAAPGHLPRRARLSGTLVEQGPVDADHVAFLDHCDSLHGPSFVALSDHRNDVRRGRAGLRGHTGTSPAYGSIERYRPAAFLRVGKIGPRTVIRSRSNGR